MPTFAANLSTQFNEVPFLQRFAAAAQAGFDAVEFLFPYDYPAEQLKTLLDDNGLKLVLFNTAPTGQRGCGGMGGFSHSRPGSGGKSRYRQGSGLRAGAGLPTGAHHGGNRPFRCRSPAVC